MIDTAAIAGLFGAPNSRPWLSLCRVKRVYADPDNAQVVWVDLEIELTGQLATARLSAGYVFAGGGGLWVEPAVNSEVLVAWPSPGVPEKDGAVHPDMTNGVVICSVPNEEFPAGTGADAPDPQKVLLVLSAAQSLVVKKAGGHTLLKVDAGADKVQIAVDGGDVELACNGSTTVTLADGTLPVVRVGDSAGPFAIQGPGNARIKG